ncbi:hypothetical protein ASG60_09975 [Methylobacterium sp. Leaf469]|uniref:hypothetical protein n=1 Tax=unclassified Methylobacterium TaxID=2615210 RepID=UPI0006F69894|nr:MULTISPECIES: hypothetical protein [unclassified Methylobacterium]USU34061.1 hypothetical protein NG677_10565 [Methylobacterium sp. OTU13CASTA1]KQO59382.1 hypothetical protein ASF22_06910 [Methylobacterium sp. Leaf87]KQP28373.1 hypothetical protein ASF27_07235 [Methylobacterium sp. Leaf102]KQP34753.1 hypothetical protein ASF25_15570 [Methylobacterium sp. Leaf100]KQP58232.1 hypothetical protein ASF52_14085 [Methylobacterium sp. Leaf112]
MRPNRSFTTFALGLVLAATLQPALARSGREEITPAEEREFNYDANIPGCQASEVLERLSTNFAEKEAKFWNSSLTIVSYERIERTAWRPWGLDFVPRRYCSAVATTSDGVRRKVDYSVRDGLGIIGADWGIEFCVHGLDRNLAYAYATACREARP